MFALNFLLVFLWIQTEPFLKPAAQFEILTNYDLRKKPEADNTKIVFEPSEETKRTNIDLLPFVSVTLKVKKWNPDVTHVKVVDQFGKPYLRKKVDDEGVYTFDMGFTDDMKDKVTPGKFIIQFTGDKKVIEQITVEVDPEGTFLVNGEKR